MFRNILGIPNAYGNGCGWQADRGNLEGNHYLAGASQGTNERSSLAQRGAFGGEELSAKLADLIAGLLMLVFGVTILLMWSFQR